jgi:hypothetical protein
MEKYREFPEMGVDVTERENSNEAIERSIVLKAQLLSEGLTVDVQTKDVLVGDSHAPLTLADYASTSGVTLRLPGDIWVNAPLDTINSNFVLPGKNRLIVEDSQAYILNEEGAQPVDFVNVPEYFDKNLRDGSPIIQTAVTHADRVRISPVNGCSMTCNYCDIPFDKAPDSPKYRGTKPITNLLESIDIALADSKLPAKHILISGGTPRKSDYMYEAEVYETVAQTFPEVDVDIMMVPMPGIMDLKRLKAAGINGFSINLELYNEEIAKGIMRNKAKAMRSLYLDFIDQATNEFGLGKVRSLLLVGLEPIADTLRGVEELARRGCDPVLSPFRPDPITPLGNLQPPSAEDLLHVWQESLNIIEKYPGVKLGPRCIPCMHNCLAFPDDSGDYYHSKTGGVSYGKI